MRLNREDGDADRGCEPPHLRRNGCHVSPRRLQIAGIGRQIVFVVGVKTEQPIPRIRYRGAERLVEASEKRADGRPVEHSD